MITLLLETKFDCTCTGVTGKFQASRLPAKDINGAVIETERDWVRSRNQQRNLETLIQILSLRTQPLNLSTPINNNNTWSFQFDIENNVVYGENFRELYQDCKDVPMIINLNEDTLEETVLVPEKNIWIKVA